MNANEKAIEFLEDTIPKLTGDMSEPLLASAILALKQVEAIKGYCEGEVIILAPREWVKGYAKARKDILEIIGGKQNDIT